VRIGTSVSIGTVQDAWFRKRDVAGTATWTDIQPITIGTDLRVGRNISQDDVISMASGTLSIDRANTIGIGGDLDVGQTAHGGSPTTGGNAIGGGNVAIRDIVGAVTVLSSVEVGRTSSVAGNVAQGNGTLTIERGCWRSRSTCPWNKSANRTGDRNRIDYDSGTFPITVGGNIDVGRAGGSTTNVNTGNGTAMISDTTVSVGFADPLAPGNVNVGRGIFTGASDADAVGMVTFERASLQVAGRIIVGELSGGVGKLTSSADGSLKLVDSLVDTPRWMSVRAQWCGWHVGQFDSDGEPYGRDGRVTLGGGSKLIVDLGGTMRATGGSGAANTEP
jgi:hypothetical protein